MLRTLFFITLAALSLGQLSAVIKTGESGLYLFDICVVLFSSLGVLYFLLKKKLIFPRFTLILFSFSLLAAVSLTFQWGNLSFDEFAVSSLYLFRWLIYLVSAVVVYNMLQKGLLSAKEVIITFVISALFVSLAGFIQLIYLPDLEVLDPALGWDPHKNRLVSTFFDPNFTGAYLISCLVLLVFGIERSMIKVTPLNRKYIILTVLIILLAVFLTFSRSSWGMLAVIVLIYGILKYRLLLILSLLISFSAYFFVPRVQTRISGVTDPADSASLRLVSWANTWRIAEDNLLFGVGFNTFRYAQREYGFLTPDTFEVHSGSGADSSLLFVLATTGVFGLVLYLTGLISPVIKKNSLALITLFLGLLLHSQFVNSLFFPPIMFLWMVALLL